MTDQTKRKTIDERANEILEAGQAKTKAKAVLLARQEVAKAKADALQKKAEESVKRVKVLDAIISRTETKAKNKEARRERTRRLIITGSLAEKAALTGWDQATLLGAFLQLAEADDATKSRFHARGEEAFKAEKKAVAKKNPGGKPTPAAKPATPAATEVQPAAQAEPKPAPQPAERFYLNVSIEQKDEAKRLGAKWDPELKKWYCNAADHLKFIKWWPKEALK